MAAVYGDLELTTTAGGCFGIHAWRHGSVVAAYRLLPASLLFAPRLPPITETSNLAAQHPTQLSCAWLRFGSWCGRPCCNRHQALLGIETNAKDDDRGSSPHAKGTGSVQQQLFRMQQSDAGYCTRMFDQFDEFPLDDRRPLVRAATTLHADCEPSRRSETPPRPPFRPPPSLHILARQGRAVDKGLSLQRIT